MKPKVNDFGLAFFTHLFLIVIFWSLPFLVNWKLVLLAVFLRYLNDYIWERTVGSCPLNIAQFKVNDPDFCIWHYYMRKYTRIRISQKTLEFVLLWVIPPTIFAVSLVWQVLLGFRPLII